ncbi:glycoside hydrolase family 114 protein, partial [Piromyces sp. E2]
VICYFSGGTLEDFRDDYDDFTAIPGLVRNTYEDWPDEKWLDFRVKGIEKLLEKRIKLAASKKCDAIEVDNLDGYQMHEVKSWKNPLTKSDTIKFAKWLANTAHKYNLSIGLKNVAGIVDELSSYYDFAINEDCAVYNECRLYKNFLAKGKAVFGVTY